MRHQNGWVSVTTGQVCNSIVPGRDKPHSFSGNIPWVTLPNIAKRYLPEREHELRLTREEIEEVGTRVVPPNSVIMSCVGDFGIVAINTEPVVINQQLHAFVCSEKILPSFLSYCLQASVKQMQSRASTTTISYLNKTNCESISFLLPPVPLQQNIANVIEEWDNAIEKTVQLIAAKERHYTHELSRLISQGEHPRSHVGNFAFEVSERNRGGNDERVLSVTNSRGFVLPEDRFERRVASADLSNYKVVARGQYAYNPSRINVGSIARLNDWDMGVLSPMYVVFGLDHAKVNSDYFLHWLDSHEARERIKKSAQGSVRETVSFTEFAAIAFPLPDIDRQAAIARYLNTLREEISTLGVYVEKLKEQKRGLMQKLLTGQWRVKVAETETSS